MFYCSKNFNSIKSPQITLNLNIFMFPKLLNNLVKLNKRTAKSIFLSEANFLANGVANIRSPDARLAVAGCDCGVGGGGGGALVTAGLGLGGAGAADAAAAAAGFGAAAADGWLASSLGL